MSTTQPHQTEIRLVLFDIDGTLMITKGASSRCMKRAGKMVLGPTFEWHPVTVGTLDQQLFDQLATANGFVPTPEQRDAYEAAYLQELERELNERQQDITVLPGIADLIDALHQRATTQRDVVLGVLTGNFRRAAELKLTLSGLGLERFPVITCAEDGTNRNELPQASLQQAQTITGQKIQPKNTFIVGDTPRDIACAKANGCVPISVATGYFEVEELQEAGSALVLPTLADPTPFIERLFGPGETS